MKKLILEYLEVKWILFHNQRLERKKLKFIVWFHSKFPNKYCWADCVVWAFSPKKLNPFSIDSANACEAESKTHSTSMCYCGNWREGKCYDKLSKEEKEILSNNSKKESADDLPF